jgi:hypothetical protein
MITEEIRREMKKFLESSKNENRAYRTFRTQ